MRTHDRRTRTRTTFARALAGLLAVTMASPSGRRRATSHACPLHP